MDTILYALMVCRAEDTVNNPTGDCYFVFDTPDLAKAFALTPKFIRDFRIINTSAWQYTDTNIGERWDMQYECRGFPTPHIPMTLVIIPVYHNPKGD